MADEVTYLVKVERKGNIMQDAILPPRSYWCIQSIILTVKGDLTVSSDILMCFVCAFSQKSMPHLNEQELISR